MKRVRAEILSTRRLGAYQSLTLVAPEIAEQARPGQFVAVAMPEDRDFLLRRFGDTFPRLACKVAGLTEPEVEGLYRGVKSPGRP